MKNRDYIEENIQSSDPFIRELFSELNQRFIENESEKEVVDRMTLSDATGPIVITSIITLSFLVSLFV